MPEARDPLSSLRAAAAAWQAAGLARELHPRPASPAGLPGLAFSDTALAPPSAAAARGAGGRAPGSARAGEAAVRDHVRTTSPAGRK